MHRSFRIAAAARSAAIALRGGHGRVAVADVEAEWNSQFANQAPPARRPRSPRWAPTWVRSAAGKENPRSRAARDRRASERRAADRARKATPMATGIIQGIWNRGTAIIGRGKRSELGTGVQDSQGTTLAATGTIRTLRDRGFGYIARDTHSKRADLFFHRSAVTADGFDQLREGQPVSFEEEADPRDRNRQRATNVQPLAGKGDT